MKRFTKQDFEKKVVALVEKTHMLRGGLNNNIPKPIFRVLLLAQIIDSEFSLTAAKASHPRLWTVRCRSLSTDTKFRSTNSRQRAVFELPLTNEDNIFS